ncbi:MAG: phosphotransferase [Actinomycetota bacterium]
MDADVVAAVEAVHHDPDRLGRQLAAKCGCPTILHGDAKPENLGVTAGQLTAIDWGELTGVGAREVDVAWFAVMSTPSRFDADPDEVFTLYEKACGTPMDRVVLDLACIGSLAQMGFYLAAVARDARRPATRSTAATRLAWWVDRVRVSLERAGLP